MKILELRISRIHNCVAVAGKSFGGVQSTYLPSNFPFVEIPTHPQLTEIIVEKSQVIIASNSIMYLFNIIFQSEYRIHISFEPKK